jgi:hypothetical protein
MSEFAEIVALVEGKTEEIFVSKLLAPHLSALSVYMKPIVISKPGEKGGDVRFGRVRNDIGLHLKQRTETYLTLFIDYYGLKGDWPGLGEAKKRSHAADKAEAVNRATKDAVCRLFPERRAERRFIPYVAMHEFEALLFSAPKILASRLQVKPARIADIVAECGSPEEIDDSPETAPSKRLIQLSNGFRKTTTGIAVAEEIGLPGIRAQCPLFDEWLTAIERLPASDSD